MTAWKGADVRRGEARAISRSASSTVSPGGGSGDGCFQSGTERIVPWLVSVLAVATSSSLSAARAQALEPRGRHDGVGVDDHHVGRRGLAERRVHVRTKPRFCSRRTYSTPSNPRANASISGSGEASSATTIRVPGVVLATTLRRHSSNSSRAP